MEVSIAIGLLMFQAIKSKKPSVHFITVSAIITTIFILIDRLYATGSIHLSTEQFYIVLVFVYISFPVGLFVYITHRYGSLFSSMEQEVASRTSELWDDFKKPCMTLFIYQKTSINNLIFQSRNYTKMKNYTIILLFLFSNPRSNSAQSHYDSRLYNDNPRSETGQIRSICPCEAANFFNSRQTMYANRPIFSQNCPQYTLAYSNNRAFEGLTLSDFFKQFKRKRKVKYSKGSHIIPL